ncbi:MAG TPA: NUDIX domain-containing protein [Euzebyales bacterium]|nr:NUDIX domain-containing protein [Euzebyales bacterium]
MSSVNGREPPAAAGATSEVTLRLNAVIVAVTDATPRLLTVPHRDQMPALPYGLLRDDDRTFTAALRRWVGEQTGLELGYVEQLYTFGDVGREPGETARALSVAYLALVREAPTEHAARWVDWYDLLPWEDWRAGRPTMIDRELIPRLRTWADTADDPEQRRRRVDRVSIVFGLDPAWDTIRVLDRYELLWEAGVVWEAVRDHGGPAATAADQAWQGRPLALDHRRIAATALGRLRGKLTYRPVVFELLPPRFTLRTLQRVVEALTGASLHTQNFRRQVERGGFVEGTGEIDDQTGGRPAELFRFRPEVLRERPRPGLGVPRRN